MSLKVSAELMMYRWNRSILEMLLSHPGGPLYVNKDYGDSQGCMLGFSRRMRHKSACQRYLKKYLANLLKSKDAKLWV